MPKLIVITHAEVVVDPAIPIPDWGLSDLGRTRSARFAASDVCADVTALWSSAEQKARETAGILADARGLEVRVAPELGENDRSATGFLPLEAFEAAADAFFARPNVSFRGWETAVAAQARIGRAVAEIVAGHKGGDLAIVTHGAVGTLLWCALSRRPIDRRHDQPGQGHFWCAEFSDMIPHSGWRSIG